MRGVSGAWVQTKDDVYYFDSFHISKFYAFLKENPKDIISVQLTSTMTKEEYDRMYSK